MAHKYPPWRRAILVPFWTLEIFLMLIMIALLVAGSLVLKEAYDSSSSLDQQVHNALNLIVPIWAGLSGVCVLIIISEIVLLTRRKLSPRKFVILNTIKSTIWTALFIMDVIAWASSSGRRYTVGGLFVELGIVLSFYIPLIYGAITFHKQRKQKTTYNPLGHNGALDTAYQSQVHPTHYDTESGPAPYHGQISGTTGAAGAYDPYKPPVYNNHGDLGLAQPSPGLTSPPVPQVYVQHHDNVYEMDTRRNLHS